MPPQGMRATRIGVTPPQRAIHGCRYAPTTRTEVIVDDENCRVHRKTNAPVHAWIFDCVLRVQEVVIAVKGGGSPGSGRETIPSIPKAPRK